LEILPEFFLELVEAVARRRSLNVVVQADHHALTQNLSKSSFHLRDGSVHLAVGSSHGFAVSIHNIGGFGSLLVANLGSMCVADFRRLIVVVVGLGCAAANFGCCCAAANFFVVVCFGCHRGGALEFHLVANDGCVVGAPPIGFGGRRGSISIALDKDAFISLWRSFPFHSAFTAFPLEQNIRMLGRKTALDQIPLSLELSSAVLAAAATTVETPVLPQGRETAILFGTISQHGSQGTPVASIPGFGRNRAIVAQERRRASRPSQGLRDHLGCRSVNAVVAPQAQCQLGAMRIPKELSLAVGFLSDSGHLIGKGGSISFVHSTQAGIGTRGFHQRVEPLLGLGALSGITIHFFRQEFVPRFLQDLLFFRQKLGLGFVGVFARLVLAFNLSKLFSEFFVFEAEAVKLFLKRPRDSL